MEYEASPLEKEIISRYPEQFQGGEYWLGISIGDGWRAIILDACCQVQDALTADELRLFHWTQIKQKFGHLKMYWRPRGGVQNSCAAPNGISESEQVAQCEISAESNANTLSTATQARIRSIVDRAMERAAHTCENCGATV